MDAKITKGTVFHFTVTGTAKDASGTATAQEAPSEHGWFTAIDTDGGEWFLNVSHVTALAGPLVARTLADLAQRDAVAEMSGPSVAEPAIEQDLPQVENRRTVNQVAAVVRNLQLKLDKMVRRSGIADFGFDVTGYGRDAIAITLTQDGVPVGSAAAPENTTAPELYRLGQEIHRDALARVVQAWLAEPASQPIRTERREAAIEQAQLEDRAAAHDMKAARAWVDAQYEGAASCSTWTDQQVLEFLEETHVDGPDAFRRPEPRVLSQLGGGRQVRRMTAEIQSGINTLAPAIDIAQALYDAGYRLTDPVTLQA